MRGPKPQPTLLKIARGNPHGHALNKREPRPLPLATDTPDELTDPIARREWTERILPAAEVGIITAADRVLAIMHCELWATWQSQLAEAIKHPHVVKAGASDYPIPNPVRGMSNKTLALLTRTDELLGFSPTSRSRVNARPPAPTPTRLDHQRARFFKLDRG